MDKNKVEEVKLAKVTFTSLFKAKQFIKQRFDIVLFLFQLQAGDE